MPKNLAAATEGKQQDNARPYAAKMTKTAAQVTSRFF